MPVLPSYRNQLTGFYMRATLAFNGLSTLFLYDQILCVFSLSRIAIAISKLDSFSLYKIVFIYSLVLPYFNRLSNFSR